MVAEEYIRKTFSINLRAIMQARDKSQIDIVRDLKFSSSTVSEWCSGKKYPRIDKIQLLANYFNCKVSDLVGTESEYIAQTVTKRTTEVDARLTNFFEELSLRRDDFYFDGTKLDDDDIALLRTMIASLRDIYRTSIRNKYKEEK